MTEDEVRAVMSIVRDEMRLAFDQQNDMIVEQRALIVRLLAISERHELEIMHLRTCTPGAPPAPIEG
jgi:hypothetical protein